MVNLERGVSACVVGRRRGDAFALLVSARLSDMDRWAAGAGRVDALLVHLEQQPGRRRWWLRFVAGGAVDGSLQEVF